MTQPGLNWFQLLQSISIVATLVLTVYSNQKLQKSRKLSNYLQLTQFHRQIWAMAHASPALYRATSEDKNLCSATPTIEERQFLTFLFLHITCAYELAKHDEVIKIGELATDVRSLLSAPIARGIWNEKKRFYNPDFVSFVEESLSERVPWYCKDPL